MNSLFCEAVRSSRSSFLYLDQNGLKCLTCVQVLRCVYEVYSTVARSRGNQSRGCVVVCLLPFVCLVTQPRDWLLRDL